MSLDALTQNLINPPIPFFFMGAIAIWLKAGLEISPTVSKFLPLYLLTAIGF